MIQSWASLFISNPVPNYLRIGRRPSLLMQVLLSGITSMATAFVSSFELYLALRFVLATANAGFLLSTNVLSEYLGP